MEEEEKQPHAICKPNSSKKLKKPWNKKVLHFVKSPATESAAPARNFERKRIKIVQNEEFDAINLEKVDEAAPQNY